jgi:hypothetical protein
MKNDTWGTFDGDSWDRGVQSGWDWLDQHGYSHPGSQLNASMDGRLPFFEDEDGKQKIHIVRAKPNW